MATLVLSFVAGRISVRDWEAGAPQGASLLEPSCPPLSHSPQQVAAVTQETTIECPGPSRSQALEVAVGAGCDCPILAPDGVGDQYLEAGIEDWLVELEERCLPFADRDVLLDCSEFPCLLYVEYRHRSEAMSEEARNDLLCNSSEAENPELQYKGTAQAGNALYSVLSVRPGNVTGYERREMVRMTTGIP